MVGGYVIENITINISGKAVDLEGDCVRRLWVVDRDGDEVAVYADIDQAKFVEAGDQVWWQSGSIYWSNQKGSLKDIPIQKIGFSFDPRKPN